ncbi:ABC transporter substrate-binding protein [Pantoea allii]|uniref:ABC transporter substrate-binding protein n=1 Tax=Pantoea allii TaxID=574096 RepID=A0A2V2BHA1_9GAMM|nr:MULTISPECIES: ABC transporter substrate-binding protein [Pantoea]MBW1214397.1 ABC transporter substrate-binding protein [Pantoea allii]MBW1253990.1 ABC transporter substrate-binding protein [Pantoea allii]MBW1258002.1 ABC transporter substrate-binding protein [Pantoea allii]MBW1263259.1 ABC transporter substrate-binding protein [Pantoea allii]MBW1266805.1 ABC transporter substrate-binding protein [Pantoea allii]
MSNRSCVSVALLFAALGFTCSVNAALLTAGSPPSSAPTTFLDTKTGKIEGFMPDVAAEVARRQHLEINFSAVPFSTLIQSVIAGKIDMIVAGMTPTPEREKRISFSQPVTAFGPGLVVRDDNKKTYHSQQDLKDEIVGTMTGTDYTQSLIKSGIAKEVKVYDSPSDMMRDLSLGRIAAGMNDYPILKVQEKTGSFKGMHVVDDYKPEHISPMAFGVKKGNDKLLADINNALTAMKADGSLQKIKAKWGMP